MFVWPLNPFCIPRANGEDHKPERNHQKQDPDSWGILTVTVCDAAFCHSSVQGRCIIIQWSAALLLKLCLISSIFPKEHYFYFIIHAFKSNGRAVRLWHGFVFLPSPSTMGICNIWLIYYFWFALQSKKLNELEKKKAKKEEENIYQVNITYSQSLSITQGKAGKQELRNEHHF